MSESQEEPRATVSPTWRQTIQFALSACSPSERRRLFRVTAALSIVSLLDVAGVLLLGIASALLLASSSGQAAPSLPVSLPWLDIDRAGGDLYSTALLVLAAGISMLLLRTVLSIFSTRRLVSLAFAANETIVNDLWRRLASSPTVVARLVNSNDAAYALNYGATAGTASVIVASVVFLSDVVLVAFLSITVLVLSPLAGIVAAAVFGLAAWLFLAFISPRSHAASKESGQNNIAIDTLTRDNIQAYRETSVLGARPWATGRLEALRHRQLDNQARLQYYLLLPRYAAELVLVVSLAAVGAGIMLTAQGPAAAGLLVAYGTAASRIMPAVIRMQAAVVQIRMGAGLAERTYALVDAIPQVAPPIAETVSPTRGASAVVLDTVSFAYSPTAGIHEVSLEVPTGTTLALVGPSGSGKSTIANIVLGLLAPQFGSVRVLGHAPGPALFGSGEVAYVPQESWILHDTVRNNVTLGRPVNDVAVRATLKRVALLDHVMSLPDGIDSLLDEKGGNLSGGQRQRLGIARALLCAPSLLVLDEATSALDAASEEAIQLVIRELHGTCTVIVIAHRLRTVQDADVVAYVDHGRISAVGEFDDVQRRVADFAVQARLSGATPTAVDDDHEPDTVTT